MSHYCPKCNKHITNIPPDVKNWKCGLIDCEARPDTSFLPGGVTYVKDPRDPLLVERQKTHGSFAENAAISQNIKAIFVTHGQHGMCNEHQEALDMIALKLSRILSGQANFKDHWDDIAGYAKLASEACE